MVLAAGRQAAGLLAVSAAMKADMVALGMDEGKIRVPLHRVDLERFARADRAAAKAAKSLTGPVIATVGALIPRKGQALVIEALATLPDVTLLLIGDGPDRAALSAQAANLGLSTRVHLLGSVAHVDLPGWLAACDVMALPSSSEGLANAWVEALACGVPVVTCDIGGAREIIDHPEAGRIVAREPGAIAAGIKELLANPPDPEKVRASALRFTWAANGAALEAHLRAWRGAQLSGRVHTSTLPIITSAARIMRLPCLRFRFRKIRTAPPANSAMPASINRERIVPLMAHD